MTDLAVTAANVVAGAGANKVSGLAGEAITAGQVVYQDATTLKWKLADSDSATAALHKAMGIALNGAALNQSIAVQTSGPITIGGTLSSGLAYYLSTTPGGITLVAGVTTGDTVCLLGFAASATVLNLGITFTGVTL